MPRVPTARMMLVAAVWAAIVAPTCPACPTQKPSVAKKHQPKTTRFAIAGTVDIDFYLDRLLAWGTRHRRAENRTGTGDASNMFRERRPPARGNSDY